MWFLIKLFVGFWVLIILLTGFVTYVDNYNKCSDKDGNYNLTSNGFDCTGEKK